MVSKLSCQYQIEKFVYHKDNVNFTEIHGAYLRLIPGIFCLDKISKILVNNLKCFIFHLLKCMVRKVLDSLCMTNIRMHASQ